ncbi:MAG TPA: hypothetical protein VJ809_01610 [Pirellulales bacterium]|jgi:hypothetical protein|nr:hypothetical protein [Pirellulales bacterium]
MKRNATTRVLASGENLREATSAELNLVQGGLLQMLIPFAGKALSDYLCKLATDALSDPNTIPIEPIT